MMPASPALKSSFRPASRGIALISTLAIVAIVTVLLVSFVSVVDQDRGATQNYGQAMRADEIARGGLDTLVGLLRQEAVDPAFNDYFNISGSQTNLFSSTNPVFMLPQKWDESRFPTIVSYSGTNIYTSGQAVTVSNAPAYTLSNSINGRSISLARWNKPVLTTDSAGFPTPSWILVTRNGVALPPLTMVGNNSIGNANYVIGRYAYVIYDTSGLIDINVAGNPLDATATNLPKGLMPWVDLMQLTNGYTRADVTNMLNWRNATNQGGSATSTNYTTYITNTWATNGFMTVAQGDSTFLGRQDLINYLNSQTNGLTNALPFLTTFSREVNGPTWGPTTNAPGLANFPPRAALPPLPSVPPNVNSLDTNYFTDRTNNQIPNPLIYKTLVQGSWTRQYYPNLTAQAGEPLVKYRFPLHRLTLLETSPFNVPQIQALFGLDQAKDFKEPYRHWAYPTSSSTYKHTTAVILTLDQVALLGREPDFFELLKAGILAGSLGAMGRGDGMTTQIYRDTDNTGKLYIDPDWMPDGQIIQIGANIIDQSDADDYPTTITFNGIDYHGVENLPYIQQMFSAAYFIGQNISIGHPANIYTYFRLWNPHQPPAQASTKSPATLKVGLIPAFPGAASPYDPPGIDMLYGQPTTPTPLGSVQTNDVWVTDQPSGHGSSLTSGNTDTNGGISFPYTATSYRAPTLLTGGTAAQGLLQNNSAYTVIWSANLTGISAGGVQIQAVPFSGQVTVDKVATFPTTINSTGTQTPISGTNPSPPKGWTIYMGYVNFTPCMMFGTPDGVYHPYGLFAGVVTNTGDVVATTPPSGGYWGLCLPEYATTPPGFMLIELPNTTKPGVAPATANPSMVKMDARTSRWAASLTYDLTGTTFPQPTYYLNKSFYYPCTDPNTVGVGFDFQAKMDPVFGTQELTKYPFYLWTTNSVKPAPSISAAGYLDPDGVQRPGDNPTGSTPFAASPSPNPTIGDARPIILNHPFQSVAELGYVFRDTPLRSLDMSTGLSADAALLDLFTVEEGPVVAGRVNPNAASPQVIAALLSGSARNATATAPTLITSSTVGQLATNIYTALTDRPLLTRADLATMMTNTAISSQTTGWPKTERESIVRALAESANTRTWNFMIDVIAQSGKYPANPASYDSFVVTGERRYWLHVAIDRYTGQIVDQQLEKVGE
jgi:hypothetical protein